MPEEMRVEEYANDIVAIMIVKQTAQEVKFVTKL